MKTLAIVIWAVFVGATATVALYEVSVLPDERTKLYTEEATASAYYHQLQLCTNYLSTAIEALEEGAVVIDNCERRLLTCAGNRQ